MAGLREWQCPPQAADEYRRLGWINEACEEGQAFLRTQRGYGDYRKAMDVLSGRRDMQGGPSYRSDLSTNGLKRDVREVIGGLANIRPWAGYHTENKAFAQNAIMMNKVSRAVYLAEYMDRSIKEVLQYAAATCTGWARPCYRRDLGGTGRGHIRLMTYGSPCVLPVQLPSNNDWQQAYAVTLMDEIPIYEAHARYPEQQDRLQPTTSQYWYSPEIRQSATGNLWKRMFNAFKRTSEYGLSDLLIPMRYTTLIDLTINTTGQMIPMGKIGSPWYYEVPSVGSDVRVGTRSDGTPIYTKATEDDARLYPYRRLVISSQSCICYDGPAFNWHGQLDLIPFCVDDWPWEAIGFSLVHEGYGLQEAQREIERGFMDKVRAKLDLPLAYDINATSLAEARKVDPMMPRGRYGVDMAMSEKPFQPVVPPEVYAIEESDFKFYEILQTARQYQLGLKDVVALSKAKVLAAAKGDQLETLLEAAGPIVKDISRSMERSCGMIGQQLKYLILQYMTTAELMQFVGEDGVTANVFDYEPESIVPSHMPHEIPHDENEKPGPSRYSRIERARWFADNLKFFMVPNSLHEITQMTHRLLLLQLRRAGLPIDSQTIFEACEVGNVEEIKARYWEEQEELIEHTLKLQAAAKAQGQELNILDMLTAGKGGSAKGKGGRPSSGQQGPRTVTKESA